MTSLSFRQLLHKNKDNNSAMALSWSCLWQAASIIAELTKGPALSHQLSCQQNDDLVYKPPCDHDHAFPVVVVQGVAVNPLASENSKSSQNLSDSQHQALYSANSNTHGFLKFVISSSSFLLCLPSALIISDLESPQGILIVCNTKPSVERKQLANI